MGTLASSRCQVGAEVESACLRFPGRDVNLGGTSRQPAALSLTRYGIFLGAHSHLGTRFGFTD